MLWRRSRELRGSFRFGFADRSVVGKRRSEPAAPFPFLSKLGLDGRTTTLYVTTWGVIVMSDPTVLILASLAEGNKHGYAIMEDIKAFAGVRLGPGTLYGAICRLEERGWIRAIKSESRRVPYRITAEGSQQLKAQLALLEQVVRAGNRRTREA
jgi:DNA-binding PadR family transcriptional regulator